jgi:hypothetical protein
MRGAVFALPGSSRALRRRDAGPHAVLLSVMSRRLACRRQISALKGGVGVP